MRHRVCPSLLNANPDTDNPRCMPTGSVCCSGAGYCPAGNTCTSAGKCQAPGPTCDAGKVACGTGYAPFSPLPLLNTDTDNPRCMPTGSVCCSGAGYCPAGNTCTADAKCQAPGPTCDAGKVVCGTGYSTSYPFSVPGLTALDACLPAVSAALALDTAQQVTLVPPTPNARLLVLPVTRAK